MPFLPRKMVRAFTLLEILIVIVIVAAVAVIVFPHFQKVRQGPFYTCPSSEKQLGLAMSQYLQDFDGAYPAGIAPLRNGVGWGGSLYPYVKSTEFFRCPEDSTPKQVGSGGTTLSPVSYFYNGNISRFAQGAGARINAPARTVMVCEAVGSVADLLDTDEGRSKGNTVFSGSAAGLGPLIGTTTAISGTALYATGYMNGIVLPTDKSFYSKPTGRHSGGANYLMVDGHIKYLRGQSVSPGNSPPASTSNQTTGSGGSASAGTGGFFADGVTKPAATFSPR